jgi:hypothetical protein
MIPLFKATPFLMDGAIAPPTVVIGGVLYELDPSTDLAVPIDTVDPGFQFHASSVRVNKPSAEFSVSKVRHAQMWIRTLPIVRISGNVSNCSWTNRNNPIY